MMRLSEEKGFTLIEIIVVMPVIIFIITVLLVFSQNSYYKILAANAKTNMRLETQIILSQLQDQLLFSTDFGETKSSDLSDPYQPSGGWNFGTSPETLIIYETSLTGDRRDPDREFVYKRNYNCNSSASVYNPIAIDNVIYFSKKNENDPYHSLYRRILTPQYTTCNTNYRGQTCPEAATNSVCEGVDALLTDKLVDFRIDYFDVDNNEIDTEGSGSPLDAEKIKVNMVLGNIIFGQEVEVRESLTMRKIN